MEFKLLFAIDKSRQSYISQFAKSLEKKGIKCKIIDDLDIYDSSLTNKKIFRWLKKPTKLQKIVDEFEPDAVFTERVSHLSSLILKMASDNRWFAHSVECTFSAPKIIIFTKF